jgi:hypothetical protein
LLGFPDEVRLGVPDTWKGQTFHKARISLGGTQNPGVTYLRVQRNRRENCNRVTRSFTEHPRAAR